MGDRVTIYLDLLLIGRKSCARFFNRSYSGAMGNKPIYASSGYYQKTYVWRTFHILAVSLSLGTNLMLMVKNCILENEKVVDFGPAPWIFTGFYASSTLLHVMTSSLSFWAFALVTRLLLPCSLSSDSSRIPFSSEVGVDARLFPVFC